jgi:hypothetical protein
MPGPQADLARETLKNPYNFDILTLGKEAQDQPSTGILLCKTPNKIMVEYALENIVSPLDVAEYQIMNAIPNNLKGDLLSIEELEQE